ncbi:hypothetical protein GCM10009740_16730 [Terrabacter terrae]|uniref:Uncharacterized protein n=1 Tax=Terrabacter terrae TaxID=318434 RepID=A0ABP5FIZ6_9MICO
MAVRCAACSKTLVPMRQAFAHEAVLVMGPGADVRAPGASITAALCGHWDHEPPCPLAPHYVHADRLQNELHVRVLFATEPEAEGEVRSRIEQALAGQWDLPEGFTTPWRLRDSRPSEVLPDEMDHARRLAGG